MKQQYVDLDVLEDDHENAMDEIAGFLERGFLEGKVEEVNKGQVEELLLTVERYLQDMEELGTPESKLIISKAQLALKTILPIIKEQNYSNTNISAVETILLKLKDLIPGSINKTENEINEIFSSFSVEKIKSELTGDVSAKDYAIFIKDVAITASIKLTKSNKGLHSMFMDLFHKEITPWDIEIEISNNEDSKSLYTLWTFIEALNQIKGTKVTIEEIKKGSLWARIKILFKSPEAKKEAQDLLESTRKFAKGKLEKDFYETRKSEQEAEKVRVEKEQIQTEIDNNKSSIAVRKRFLELEALEADLLKRQLENERLKLQLFIERKSALRELLAQEIITSDEFKMLLNKQLFLSKGKENQFLIGETIENIENK